MAIDELSNSRVLAMGLVILVLITGAKLIMEKSFNFLMLKFYFTTVFGIYET